MSLLSDYRAKFPIYKDVSDSDLATALHSKYYSDIPYDEFSAKVGLAKVEAAPVAEDKGYFEKLTDTVKDVGSSAIRQPLRLAKEVVDLTDSRSVTNNSDRSLDGTTPEETGFDKAAGGRVLDRLKEKQPETLKAGSRIVDGAAGIAEVGARKGYAGIGRISAGLLSAAGDLTGSETLARLSEGQLKYADEVENSAVLRGTKSTSFEPDSIVQDAPRVATNAIGSTITSAPAIVAGAVTGGGAIPAIFATSALSDYGTSEELSTGGKIAHAIGSGAAEALGEKLGGTDKFADALTKVIGGKNALAELGVRLLTSGAKEVPSEEVTTTAQFLLDKNEVFGLNPDATLDDYVEQVIETAKVAAMQGAGMAGAGGVIKAVKDTGRKPNGQLLEVSQSNPADYLLAAQKQADYDGQQRQAASDLAVTKVTDEANTIDDAIQLAQTAIDTPLVKPSGLLGSSTQSADIFSDDILGDSNVSNQNDAVTSMVAAASESGSDNVQGSVANLPVQSDGRGMDNATETLTQSIGSDQPIGNAGRGNDAVADRPFAQATDEFLPQMRSMTTDAKVIGQIDSELALRGIAADSVEVTGEKINKEWTAFSPDSGTLNIPRAEMPQIKAEHRGAMVNFLNARGVSHEQDTVQAETLKPTQMEFSESKVKKAKEFTGGNRSILISQDNHVLDGHHQWLAKLEGNEAVDVIRLNAPITQLLNDVTEFPSSTVDSGASGATTVPATKTNKVITDVVSSLENQRKAAKDLKLEESFNNGLELANQMMNGEAVSADKFKTLSNLFKNKSQVISFLMDDLYQEAIKAKPAKSAKPKPAKAPKTKSLLTVMRDLGGLANSEKLDITGEERGFAAGGYNQIFKKSSTRSLKGLIESGDLDDYLPYNMRLETNGMNDDAFDSTEAYDYLADRIRNGESVLPYAVEEELRALQYESNAVNDVADELTEDEINEQFTIAANEERESTTNAQVFNTDSENGSTASGTGREETAQANTEQPAQVAQDLLGDNTAAKQALADAERTKDAKRNSGTDSPESFTLTGSTSEADQAAAAGAQDLFAAPKAESKPAEKAKDEARFANNKIFTADKVAAARARLKSKLNTLNSGIDPELLIDGMTIAGAYIETGVRKFSDYAKAMTDDFGDSIKPYLLSFYEAARAYPSIDKEGMTDAESAAKEHQALLIPAVLDQAKEVIGQGLVTTPKAKAKPNGQIKLTQDWGVDNIDGWTDNKDGTGTNERENGVTNGVKEQFLAEGKKYLTQVSKLLEAEGWQAHTDRRGRTQKPVSVNEAGPAVSGEVTLTMRKGNAGVYVDLGTSSIRGLTGNHPQGVSVMIRATGSADTDQYATKGQNIWLSADLSSTELANKLVQTAERYVKNTEQAEEGNQNARTTQNQDLPDGSTQSNLLTEQPRSSDSEPMGSGLAAESDNTAGQGRVSSRVSQASGNGTQGTSRSNRNESSSGSRETSNAGNSTSAADDLNDFAITDETGIGEGSLAQKYNDNITAIKLIKTLESENRAATPEERNQLAKYNGFGALSKVFEKNNPKYQELKDLLTEAEYEAARASILNAYYTSPTIVKSMYDAIAHMGFKGGRVLEPSLGSGNFFGMMPAAMRNKSKLNGVELDILTSRLAKYLYPNANISVATGFQEYKAPQGYFDLVISNPPFGSEQLRDSEKADYSGFSIHNFFIAKSIDKLRDDGILAVVVSHSFMDAMDSKAREWISKRAVLRGAVRLPNTAFKDNAGTEVITDILFFQKTNMPDQNPDWVTAKNDGNYSFNEYFYANPMNVLGRVEDITNQYGNTYTVASTGDMAKQLKEFIAARLMANVYVEPEKRIEVLDSADSTVPDGVKVGTFYTDEKGVVRQRLPDMLGAKRSTAWEVPNAKAQERMLGMMNLRDLLRNQMRLERDPMATEKEIEANRKQMNSKYDAYLKEFGYLNSMTNRRLFLDDTESALLQALEIDYDQGVTAAKALTTGMDKKEPSAQKADIFTRRVLFPPSDSITVNNAKDALLASLNVKGVVDVDYMAEVYSKPKAEIISELGDVVYNDPNRGYVTADEYLSGDVKTKLTEAKSYAKDKPEFNRNVEALEKVIPKDKLPSEIYASAGANWIPADVYADFASEITGIPKDGVEFKYISAAATWLSEKTRGGDAGKMTSDYGTPEINSFDMFALLINGKAPEVREMVGYGSDRRSVVNIEKTEAARSKLEKVKETWNSWIFKDADRADRLATIYNDKHNRTVARKFDGSHMQFAGMTPVMNGKPFDGLRQHQKDVVWRAIQDRNVLLDHVVGAGKTMAAAAIAMEMKRLGIARKPLFVVPNHLTLQWRSEFTKLYPASNILAATPEDFAKDKREKLFSKMVTGNYDAIIIGHSSLTKIGLPADVEAKMYDEQVKEIAQAIEAAKTERGDRGITRDMEKIKQNLETKIKKLKDKAGAKDNVVSFDELGIDALVVDEMHEFKNLFFTTQMQRTAGLGNPSGSGKALDLFMKIKFMTDTIGENVPLITMTGTPVSNSLAEMFTMQRFMKYPSMKRQDLHLFDAWAKQFGEVENVYEVAPSGVGYRQSTRFSKFKNLPALMGSYTGFADIITMQDLKDQTAAQIDPKTGKAKVFPVPKLKTGKPINVIAQRSDLQRDFFGVPQLATNEQTGEIEFELDPENAIIEQNKEGKYQIIAQVKNDDGEIVGRQSVGNNFDTQEDAELELVTKSLTPKTFIDPESLLGKFANLATLTRESKGKINALSLTGLASKAGLDYRIIDPSATDFEGSKINQSVTNMVSLWKETTKDKGTQIVFCDMSIPNSARNDMSSKERRIYVRDREGELTHKAKGVVYAPEGYEGFPFYITKGRNGFDVYEAVSGTMVRDYGIADKAEAKAWIANFVESESNRDRVFVMRDTKTIDQSDIEEYREAKELEVADDGSNEISTADLEAVAGSSKFSVYDDIKTKLISAGVPENQIAFIHDYNTPKQKEELFKRVNSGDVRFLFGSTPKLGAGTNVQKRLVGLHHIDAPWRPSDLEQREGRIIRQGNDLYARDPENFEISIWRYATEQTYDTRRWQLLEHKAAGIEQLRKYSGESEIEDVASEASNSADMKAAASGNPLILEETKLSNEVKRLINLEKAHADSRYAMARKVRDNTSYVNEYLPNQIAMYQQMIATVKANPIPEDKTKVAAIKIDGKATTSREVAEKAISDLALKVRSFNTMGEADRVIQYRGIEFTVNRGSFINSLALRAPTGSMHVYGDKEGVSPSGLITRFNNYIDSFTARIEESNKLIEKTKVESASLSQRLDEAFEYADKLKETQAQHANVKRRLMKSNQLESVPDEQRPEFDRLVKDRKETLKELGFDKALSEAESDNEAPMFSRNEPFFSLGTGTRLQLTKSKDQFGAKVLNKALVKYFGDNWSDSFESVNVPDTLLAYKQEIKTAFGKELRFVSPTNDDFDIFAGVQLPNSPNSIYVNARAETNLATIAGHELYHTLERQRPDLHKWFKSQAQQYLQDFGAYHKNLNSKLQKGEKPYKSDVAMSELLADFTGDALSDPIFLQQLANENGSKFKGLLNITIKFLNEAITKLRNLKSSKYISDVEALRNDLRKALLAFSSGKQISDVIGSRNDSATVAKLFQELTLNDDLFKYPRSSAKDMQAVFDDVAQGLVHIEKSKSFDDEVSELYSVYPIDATGNPNRSKVGFINVYKDGKVEINVSSLGEGFGGSGIYAAVGNWAYNNGKVFAGDREGISPAGITRRLENMISLALKFGTTDHIMPHQDQMSDLGFDWKEGDYNYNLAEMLKASFNAIRNGVYVTTDNFGIEVTEKSNDAKGVSKLDDLVYDFDKHMFMDVSNGQEYTESDFDKLARTAEARNTYAGRTTLQRAAIGNTFMGATGEGKRSLLEQLGKLSLQNLELTDPQLAGIFYSRSKTQYAGGNLTPESETRIEALQRAVQDQFAIFKRTQEKLLANGGVVGDRENVYEAMMRYPARFRNKVTDFMRGTFNPIVDRIGKLDTNFNELGRYMLALHAKEGNAYIQTINEDKDAGVGMTNAEAAKVIKEAEARADFAEFDSIARDLQNITNMRLNMLVTAGVYSQDQADAMRKQYQFYVPVKGFADLEVDDLPAQFTGSGFSTTKKLDMRRKGRKSEPSQIVENIIRDYQVAVAAVEKANVGRYLRNLVAVNPNSSLWTLEEAPTQKVIEQDKRIWAVMDGNNEAGRFTTKREASTTAALLNKGSSKNAQVVQVAPKETVVDRPIAYDKEQEVRFIENGKEYRIQLKDPLMAASYNGLNKVVTNNMLVRGADNILTFFREMWTQKSPVFIVLNGFLRDPQSALAVGIPLRGLSWTKKMYGNYASAAKALYQFETESEITNERMRKHLENYRKNGGGIGYAFVGDIEQTQSELNKALRIASGNMNLADRAYNNQVIKSIEVLNAVAENTLRFAAYVADIESGRSMLDAVKMSKEITVNFNRKGEQSAGIGRIFLFANSNIQGINNLIVQPIKQNPKVAAATFGSFIATGFALGMIEALLNGGDDDEENADLFEENSRMMSLKIGDMQIKLDNAYGVGWFVYLGRMIARTVLRPETAGSNALNVASAFFDHFSFMGNPIPNEQDLSAKRAIGGTAPTLIAPFVYALLNTSRFGNDLYPDYDGGSSPDAYRSWKGTKNSLYADAAIFLNESTGGNVVESGMIDVSPETLKMLTNYGLGGVGTFFGNTGSSVSNLIDGEIDSQNIPFVNRWYDPLDVQNYQRRFYNEAGKARQFKDQVNKLYKAGLTERSDELLSKNEALYAAGLEAQSIWTYVNSLREAENFIKQDKTLSKSEKKEMLELNHKERIEIMKMYHNEYIMKVGE